MNEGSITQEVRALIADKIAAGEMVQITWLTNEVVQKKSAIEGDDLPFYRVCAYSHVREIVRRCIGKYDAKRPTTDEQLVLPGYHHLQVAYTMPRGDEIVLVPVHQCTARELLARADEYQDMAAGCEIHAEEIRKFVSQLRKRRAA